LPSDQFAEDRRSAFLIECFRSAHEELLLRIKQREEWLRIGLATQVVILAAMSGFEVLGTKAAGGSNPGPPTWLRLISMPVALIVTLLYSVEERMIGHLASYLSEMPDIEASIANSKRQIPSRALHRDLSTVMTFNSEALAPPLDDSLVGRAIRRSIRTIAQTAEGELGFALFFMRAVRRREGKILVPEQVKGESVPSRLARVLTAFSAAFGRDLKPTTRGKTWDALNTVFLLRDRLIHPRRPNDVDLKVEHLSTAMDGLTWLSENSLPILYLDQAKTMDLIGVRRRA
jgi:hypothetical protein